MKNNLIANRTGVAGYAPTLAILLALALTFFGCSSDDGEDNNNPGSGVSSSSDVAAGGSSSSEVTACTQTSKIQGEPVEYQGETYPTVVICGQTWFAKNLNYNASGSKCYDNSQANCDKYGRLYTWDMAKTACPAGWHLPTNAEWDALYKHADSDYEVDAGSDLGYSETAGKHLKAQSGWNENGNGSDTYGFAALPGGGGLSDGSFINAGDHGDWWSASEYSGNRAYFRFMSYYGEYANWDDINKTYLFSVRCVKD